jgi:hypothetical protein
MLMCSTSLTCDILGRFPSRTLSLPAYADESLDRQRIYRSNLGFHSTQAETHSTVFFECKSSVLGKT